MSDHSVTVIPKGSAQAEGISIAQSGIFPDLMVDDFRAAMRVDTTIPTERVKLSLMDAALKVNKDLAPLTEKYPDIENMEDLPAAAIDGKSVLLHQYFSAVYNEAKASLNEKYRDFDSTNSGHSQADKLELGIDDYRQNLREIVRSILGKPRARISLL